MPAEDLSQFSLAELFRMEAETHLAALSDGIIRLETPSNAVLDDLMRAVLPLHFDDVRPQGRTPHYAAGTRTDFLLAPERVAVTRN